MAHTATALFITEESQDRNVIEQDRHLEAGAEAEAMEGAAYWLALPAFFKNRTQDHLDYVRPSL